MKKMMIAIAFALIGSLAFAIGPSPKLQEQQNLKKQLKSNGDYIQNEDGTYTVFDWEDSKYPIVSPVTISDFDEFVESVQDMISREKKIAIPSYLRKIGKAGILDDETCLYEFEFADFYTDLIVIYLENEKTVAYKYRFQTPEQIAEKQAYNERFAYAFSIWAANVGRDISAIGNAYMNQ